MFVEFALGNRPSAVVFVFPKRSAEMDQKYLNASFSPAKQQYSGALLFHLGISINAAGVCAGYDIGGLRREFLVSCCDHCELRESAASRMPQRQRRRHDLSENEPPGRTNDAGGYVHDAELFQDTFESQLEHFESHSLDPQIKPQTHLRLVRRARASPAERKQRIVNMARRFDGNRP